MSMQERRQEREDIKQRVLSHLGLVGHPKADALFELAWEYGHAAGEYAIRDCAEEFSVLLDKENKL